MLKGFAQLSFNNTWNKVMLNVSFQDTKTVITITLNLLILAYIYALTLHTPKTNY